MAPILYEKEKPLPSPRAASVAVAALCLISIWERNGRGLEGRGDEEKKNRNR